MHQPKAVEQLLERARQDSAAAPAALDAVLNSKLWVLVSHQDEDQRLVLQAKHNPASNQDFIPAFTSLQALRAAFPNEPKIADLDARELFAVAAARIVVNPGMEGTLSLSPGVANRISLCRSIEEIENLGISMDFIDNSRGPRIH